MTDADDGAAGRFKFANNFQPHGHFRLVETIQESNVGGRKAHGFGDEHSRLPCSYRAAGNQDIGLYGIPDKVESNFFCLRFTVGGQQAVIIGLTSLFTSRLRMTNKDYLLRHRVMKLV